MSLKKEQLAKIRILVADNDHQMATVLMHLLKHMGFSKMEHVRNGEDAIRVLKTHQVDIVITDWEMPHVDGIMLTRFLRCSDESPNRALPVVMLTARAERNDVEFSRDAGITEFVVKPYTSKTLFNRIEQLVDNPRDFVISPHFTGPTRRRKDDNYPNNRRSVQPKKISSIIGAVIDDGTPKLLPADFTLKKRIGLKKESINALITPEVLHEAQQALETMKDESLHWIRDDIRVLEQTYNDLAARPNVNLYDNMKVLLLSIKSRAGTFGYKNASDAAQTTYRFMRNNYVMSKSQHNEALLKFIQAIKVLLSQSVQGKDEALTAPLLAQLEAMAAKFEQNQG